MLSVDVSAEIQRNLETLLALLRSVAPNAEVASLWLRRVHFWVLVKGWLRGVNGAGTGGEFFIEPVWPIMYAMAAADLPFLGQELLGLGAGRGARGADELRPRRHQGVEVPAPRR